MLIYVYSTPGCVQCNATYRKLDQLGLDYVSVDLSVDEKAHADIVALGFTSAPVIKIPGQDLFSGYQPGRLEKYANELPK